MKLYRPPPNLSTYEWSNQYRYVAQGASATPGKFNTELTPYMEGLYDVLDSPDFPVVVAMKSAQIAWTETVNNKIGKHAHIDPLGIIVMFAKDGAAKAYEKEKFVPMVKSTPVLRERINTSRSKASGNTWDYKHFQGGFIKLVSSNSPSSVKSTAASLLIVEEPDDSNTNVRGQGSSLKLLEDRGDTFEDSKIIFGGTPTIKGLSQVESAYAKSDKRIYLVPCHECEDFHELNFDNLSCKEYEKGYVHDIYGSKDPETAFYCCPHCGGIWDDFQKNINVAAAKQHHEKGWFIRENSKTAGFRFNALMSPFPGARLNKLMAKYLEAIFKRDNGNESDWIAFVNTRMGKTYEYGNNDLDVDALKAKALDYEEATVPAKGLILTAGVDVQHDRLHILIRAWGRHEQSWLVLRAVIYGTTSQKNDPVWQHLSEMLWQPFKHEFGVNLIVNAVSIDSSDGNTNDAVYAWVAKHQKQGVMAIKGANSYDAALYRIPKRKTKKTANRTKAEKYGVEIWLVGTTNAKDMIVGANQTGRLRLNSGSGAMFWYKHVPDDYYEQLLGEVKAPHRTLQRKLVWQQKAGCAVEDLDCEVYNLHASRRLGVHLRTEAQWSTYENNLKQVDLFSSKNTGGSSNKQRRKRVTGGV